LGAEVKVVLYLVAYLNICPQLTAFIVHCRRNSV